jgi:hypothetical protein
MTRHRTLAWLALLLSALLPSATRADEHGALPRQLQQLFAMTPAQFEASAEVKDDSLETVATITTEKGWQEHDGLLGVVNSDNFFRVFIDKKTGKTRFQVYHVIRYRQRGRASYDSVNYETPDGPVSVTLTVINRSAELCRAYQGCTYTEDFGFDVDEALLRTVAAHYAPGKVAIWKYRLKAKSGQERNDGFAVAEVAGMLAAVDRYRAAHGLGGPSAP